MPEVSDDQLALVDEPPAPYEPPATRPRSTTSPSRRRVAEEPAEDAGVRRAAADGGVLRRGREAAEDAAEPDEDAEPADELEETPEFLQETPEHDRLWFEQKPPRDFDF